MLNFLPLVSALQPESVVELTEIENALLCFASGKRQTDACRKTHFHKRDFSILP
jgi:hypothetical protein